MAKLPESSNTSGRRSGGMTGITSSTIHSGLLSLSRIALDDLQPIDQVLFLLLRAGFGSLSRSSLESVTRSRFDQQLANGFGAHVGLERAFAVLLAGGAVFFFGQQLLPLQRRVLGSMTT